MNTGRTGAFSFDIVSMVGRGWVHAVWSSRMRSPALANSHAGKLRCQLPRRHCLRRPAYRRRAMMPRTSSASAIGSVRTALMHAWHEALHPSLIDQEFAIDRHLHGVDQIVSLEAMPMMARRCNAAPRHALLFCRRSVRVDAVRRAVRSRDSDVDGLSGQRIERPAPPIIAFRLSQVRFRFAGSLASARLRGQHRSVNPVKSPPFNGLTA